MIRPISEQNSVYRRSMELQCSMNPKMDLGLADSRAKDEVKRAIEYSELYTAIIVLYTELFKIDDQGWMTKEMADSVNANDRLKWAAKKASELHAGTACSPFAGGFKKLYEDLDDEIEQLKMDRKFDDMTGLDTDSLIHR